MPNVGIVQGDKLNVSVGALYGGIGGINGGIAYAVGTYGGPDRNLTLGENVSVDLALMNTVRTPVFPGYPYVDFVIKW